MELLAICIRPLDHLLPCTWHHGAHGKPHTRTEKATPPAPITSVVSRDIQKL